MELAKQTEVGREGIPNAFLYLEAQDTAGKDVEIMHYGRAAYNGTLTTQQLDRLSFGL